MEHKINILKTKTINQLSNKIRFEKWTSVKKRCIQAVVKENQQKGESSEKKKRKAVEF